MLIDKIEFVDTSRTFAEINYSVLDENITAIKKHNSEQEIIAVIKANAYGHGAREIFKRLFFNNGIKFFAVSNLNEALEIRKITKKPRIIVLGYTNPEFAEYLAVNNIIQTITSFKYAHILNRVPTRKPIQAHIKIDTGMGRLGLRYDDPEITAKIKEIKNMRNFHVSHIFTHFADADCEKGEEYTNLQLERIEEIAKAVNLRYHCDNSAGSANFTDKGDFVRAGISIYGIKPDIDMQLPYELKPVMTFKSTVVQVKNLKKDEFVSYGCTYKTEKDTKIATICCGYADGYHRTLSNKGYVWYNGKTLPIIGRICMDMFMVNAENTDINVGDQVELFGSNIPVNDLAKMAGTIGYELTCSISQRVPRVYKLR